MLVAHARTLTAVGDAAPLWLEAYRNVAEIRRILSARLSAKTCLVGRCFAVEEEFYFRYKATFMEAGRDNVTSEMKAAFPTLRREVGYEAYMDAAYQGLRFAYPSFTGARPPPLTSEQRRDAQAFALRYMGVLATAPRINGSSERRFADLLRVLLDSNYLELPFKAELAGAWDRPALQNALRARGVFDEDDAAGVNNYVDILNKK